jgi:hypothetical protein
MLRAIWRTVLSVVAAAVLLSGCQRPTSSSNTPKVDDFVDASAPSTVGADASTDGRTYRVTRNNEPDLILPYQFTTSFNVSITVNDKADDKDYDVEFPVTLTQISVKVEQASGGIVTPTSSPVYADYVVSQASGNKFAAVNISLSMNIAVWYTLPSALREALITVTFALKDDDGATYVKTVTVNVAP